jgi:hypothetical protein
MWAWIDRNHRYLLMLALVALLATGFAAHRDYGIPWDEPIQQRYADTVWRYVAKGDERLLSSPERVYGPAHEMFLYGIDKVLHRRDSPEAVATRHLANFLVFVVGVVFFYRLGRRGLKSWVAGLLGCVGLVLSPPIFAHAFYNTKDLPFLAFFIVSFAFWSGPGRERLSGMPWPVAG